MLAGRHCFPFELELPRDVEIPPTFCVCNYSILHIQGSLGVIRYKIKVSTDLHGWSIHLKAWIDASWKIRSRVELPIVISGLNRFIHSSPLSHQLFPDSKGCVVVLARDIYAHGTSPMANFNKLTRSRRKHHGSVFLEEKLCGAASVDETHAARRLLDTQSVLCGVTLLSIRSTLIVQCLLKSFMNELRGGGFVITLPPIPNIVTPTLKSCRLIQITYEVRVKMKFRQNLFDVSKAPGSVLALPVQISSNEAMRLDMSPSAPAYPSHEFPSDTVKYWQRVCIPTSSPWTIK